MDPLKLRRVLVLLFLGLVGWPMTSVGAAAGGGGDSASCRFPAVYNFGDSNSDTGGISAAFDAIQSPNGMTFFGHPSGRACDGRLIIDFMAEKLKVPYLSAYLDSVGTSFRYGANFATGGSSIRPGGYSPFHLALQVSQFIQFKSRTTYLYNRLHSHNSTAIPMESSIARPREFSKALYMFDIAQNDLFHGFQYSCEEQVRASIPDMIDTFSEAVQQIYKEGARYFWVHNTGPVGCLPFTILNNQRPSNIDSIGCVKSANEVAQELNRQLKNLLLKLRKELPLARITHVDMYSAKYLLISKAKTLGFVDPVNYCCGSFHGLHLNCGKKEAVNGTVYDNNACKDPSRHVSWDGIHYSEAANLWVANHILNGSFSEPPLPIDKACRWLPIR
ncbi:GDSL esterase/lipase At3g27950-like [Cucurbita moschata]|uniref:GDSL esterase/lipase At3g27950-like n=1 Tax=Cucurbita moschata TaxID=3662 RepID=A0A6J1FJD5_CUCMO|nr:GDSL esterase/lipase At3g27950-like [Cucurbita moschata]